MGGTKRDFRRRRKKEQSKTTRRGYFYKTLDEVMGREGGKEKDEKNYKIKSHLFKNYAVIEYTIPKGGLKCNFFPFDELQGGRVSIYRDEPEKYFYSIQIRDTSIFITADQHKELDEFKEGITLYLNCESDIFGYRVNQYSTNEFTTMQLIYLHAWNTGVNIFIVIYPLSVFILVAFFVLLFPLLVFILLHRQNASEKK